MRREFHKQLTKLRKIQDNVLRQQAKYERCSMDLIAHDIGSNTVMRVNCYRYAGKSEDPEMKTWKLWERPHHDEIPYQRMLDEINEFFSFKTVKDEPLTEE